MAFSILKLPNLTVKLITEALGITVAPVEPLPTFEQLALTAPSPTALDDLSIAIGVRPELLRRVARGQQPLPVELIPNIAAQLGLQAGEVAAAARQVTNAADHVFPGLVFGRRNLEPLPPDRLLGDPIYMLPITPTAPPVFGA